MDGRPVTTDAGRTDVDGLDFMLDRDAEVPLGVQLAWALRTRIRDGRFAPGARLPGLRDVAEALGVNANTVRAVYQRLEHEGAVLSQQGSGTFVASTPQSPSATDTIAAEAAREAHATGVDPRDVAAALYVASEDRPAPVDETTERRRLLRTQIAALERTLGEIESDHPGVAPVSTDARAGIGPALLSCEELEQVRTLLVRRLTTVQSAIDALAQEQAVEEVEPKAAKAPKRTAQPRAKARPAPAGA
jgi:DNA-binding transcriptional regulator YhcF (GntR family)